MRRRKDGRAVRGRRLRVVTPECATEERGAPPRPGRACSPPPPARRRRPAHFLPGPPLRVEDSPASPPRGTAGCNLRGGEPGRSLGPASDMESAAAASASRNSNLRRRRGILH